VQRHIQNADDLITDEDMETLQLNISTTLNEDPDCKSLRTEEIKKLRDRPLNPLDILSE